MPALLDAETAPRSTITLAEFRDRVRGDLGLRDSSLLTDNDLTNWGNEASDIIARETGWYRTSDLMGTTLGTKEYALPRPTDGRCLRIEEVQYGTEQLEPVTLAQLLQWDPNYRQAGNGTPDYYYLRGSSGFGLHPTPNTTSATNLLVVYVAKPPRVTAANETFYVPHTCEDGLIVYAKRMASEKDSHGEGGRRVAFYAQQWAEFLRAAKAQANSAAERIQTVMGGDAGMTLGGSRRVPWSTSIRE